MSHPILAAASAMDEALKAVADTNPAFMPTADKAEALVELARIESRVGELRMRILVDASDVAESTGARSAADWLADATHGRFEDARADLFLATALDRRWVALGAAVREGRVTTVQARAVVRALDELPVEVPTDVLDRAEAALIEHAARFAPKQLARIGRHILTVVAPTWPTRPRAGGWPRRRPKRGGGPGSPCAARVTAPPASPPCSPTPLRRGSRSTSRRTPTRGATGRRSAFPSTGSPAPLLMAAPTTQQTHRRRTTRSRGSPTPDGWARRSASCRVPRPEATAGARRRRHDRDRHHPVRDAHGRARRGRPARSRHDPERPAHRPVRRRHDHRRPGETVGVQRPHHPRGARRQLRGPRPGALPASLHRRPAARAPPARPHLPRRGVRHPRHLGRGPPLDRPGRSVATRISTTACCSARTTTTGHTTPTTSSNG